METAPFLSALAGAVWRERRFSGEEMRRARDARLRSLIEHARRSTVLWRDRLAHIDASLPINLAQIQPITKAELMARFDDSIAGGELVFDEVANFARDTRRAGERYRGFVI